MPRHGLAGQHGRVPALLGHVQREQTDVGNHVHDHRALRQLDAVPQVGVLGEDLCVDELDLGEQLEALRGGEARHPVGQGRPDRRGSSADAHATSLLRGAESEPAALRRAVAALWTTGVVSTAPLWPVRDVW